MKQVCNNTIVGVAVFITNFSKGLKAGEQLAMYDCELI